MKNVMSVQSAACVIFLGWGKMLTLGTYFFGQMCASCHNYAIFCHFVGKFKVDLKIGLFWVRNFYHLVNMGVLNKEECRYA